MTNVYLYAIISLQVNKQEVIKTKNAFTFEHEDKEYTLRNSIELFALGICENIAKEEQRTEDILQKCKILDSLSNALIAIRN